MSTSRIKLIPADGNNKELIGLRIRNIKTLLAQDALAVLVVEATSRCNLACEFCGMHSKRLIPQSCANRADHLKKKIHMDLKLFREVITKCEGMQKLKVLYLHGNGEPLLNPHIVNMVEMAKKADIAEQISIVTNGVLLSGEMFHAIARAGAAEIRVSLDILDPSLYHRIKGRDQGARVLQNIDACIALMRKDRIAITFTILCANPNCNNRTYSTEAKRIYSRYAKQTRDLPNFRIRYRDIFRWVDSINRKTVRDQYQRPTPCEQPFYLLMIHSDGDISMCCADTTKELLVGNVQAARSMRDILTSRILRHRRREVLQKQFELLPTCQRCEVYSIVDSSLWKHREELLHLLPP